ncbi:DUF6624 domain-containing protein [Spongiimicrobium salis]|uniref:DUF6624 domain-containing protein n=1 Tax=Spongiimicrobium salis TaxID=1667022 RepID=UPI00374CB850
MKLVKLLLLCSLSISLYSQTPSSSVDLSSKTLDSLRTHLESILTKDQVFRSIYKEAENKLGKDSAAMEYFWEVVEQQDKLLEQEVTAILDQYGWLGISQVGRRANTTLWAVLQHGSVASKEKYAPLLKASVLKKESRPAHYARLIDRMLINSKRPQEYGTQYEYDKEGNAIFFPIHAPEYIDRRRKELGLSGIQEFAEQLGITWAIPQK